MAASFLLHCFLLSCLFSIGLACGGGACGCEVVRESLRILSVDFKLYLPDDFQNLNTIQQNAAKVDAKNTVRQAAVLAANAVSFWKEGGRLRDLRPASLRRKRSQRS